MEGDFDEYYHVERRYNLLNNYGYIQLQSIIFPCIGMFSLVDTYTSGKAAALCDVIKNIVTANLSFK